MPTQCASCGTPLAPAYEGTVDTRRPDRGLPPERGRRRRATERAPTPPGARAAHRGRDLRPDRRGPCARARVARDPQEGRGDRPVGGPPLLLDQTDPEEALGTHEQH